MILQGAFTKVRCHSKRQEVGNNIDGDHRGFLDTSPGIEALGYKPQDHIAAERHHFQ